MLMTREYIHHVISYLEYLGKEASQSGLICFQPSSANDSDYFCARILHVDTVTYKPIFIVDAIPSFIADWCEEFNELHFQFYVIDAAITYLEGVIESGIPVLDPQGLVAQVSVQEAA